MFQASVEQIWAMKAVKYAETHMKVSVVLKPSHHPAFDHLQNENNGGEDLWSTLSCECCQCLPSIDRGGRGLVAFSKFPSKFWSCNLLLIVFRTKNVCESCILLVVEPFSFVYIDRHWCHSLDKTKLGHPSSFLHTVLKNWTVGRRPKNRATWSNILLCNSHQYVFAQLIQSCDSITLRLTRWVGCRIPFTI